MFFQNIKTYIHTYTSLIVTYKTGPRTLALMQDKLTLLQNTELQKTHGSETEETDGDWGENAKL